MKRTVRFLWVLAVNGAIVCLMFFRLFGEPFYRATQSRAEWVEFLLEATVPVLGVVAELARWRFARWVNVGYLALLGLYWCGGAVYWWSDPFFGALLIIGVGFLIFAGLTERVYHYTSSRV